MNRDQYELRKAEYRAYLETPVWKAVRRKALDYYGCICNRCGEYGNDVHHKTYKRVGGDELVEDLEILCRECHSAHHSLDRIANQGRAKRKKKPRREMHLTGALNYLTAKHKKLMISEFGLCYRITALETGAKGEKVRNRLKEILGLTEIYGVPKDKNKMYGKWPKGKKKGSKGKTRRLK